MKGALEQIVNAVLYEGYILYPYRASSKKNQRERFTFGRVYPQTFSEKEMGAEPCVMQTECLVQTAAEFPGLKITLGFLQPVAREIGAFENAVQQMTENGEVHFQKVPQMKVAGKIFQAWMEAIERRVSVTAREPAQTGKTSFAFPACEDREAIRNENGDVVGMILRSHEILEGRIETKITELQKGLFKICVRAFNLSALKSPDMEIPEKVLQRTFASTHFILELETGEFISLLETPAEFEALARDCKNIGCWPVLAGENADRRTILASPIILYDYPEVAPESAGEFFDGTEIDEMLSLRVLTMSDEEKCEMQAEEFSRRVLERTHALKAGDFLRLHGAMREPKPGAQDFFNPARRVESVCVGGVELKIGDRVLIRPKRRADAIDMLLSGKPAIIEALEQDVEGQIHLAVVLENDPGLDLGMARQPGHRFFYGADEVEPLKMEAAA